MPKKPTLVTSTAERLLHEPVDDNQVWRGIFCRLALSIGDDAALAWFGHCRFGGVEGDRIDLYHWNAFSAAECLARHGHALCRAAQVGEARVYRSGGSRPRTPKLNDVEPRQQADGYESFRVFRTGRPDAISAARVDASVSAMIAEWETRPVRKLRGGTDPYAEGAALARQAREDWARKHGADKPLPPPKGAA